MSLTIRAAITLALVVGFYLLALSLAFGLLWLIYAQLAYGDSFNLRLSFACLVSAGMILWSIAPRFDKFVPPGPLLDPAKEPRLFAELAEIARATGQKMPEKVYLVPEMNAWVAQRGGILGIGSRRVMALGLPLMAVLSLSQFRAVLAHEFGHYYGGDTKLGSWIYQVRSTTQRTLHHLGDRTIALLFDLYNRLLLRITLQISRSQEFAADVWLPSLPDQTR